MGLKRYLGVLLVVVSFGSVFGAASRDPLWMFKDAAANEMFIWGEYLVYDTCRTENLSPLFPVDTGDKFDGQYLNFKYQFTTDTLKFRDEFDPAIIRVKDYRPGYAGFKIDWDNGITGFPLAKYKYFVFAHKGPLPNHKITISVGFNTECGSPTIFHTIGSVASSSTWKVDSIPIPAFVNTVSDSAKDIRNYYELQVIINNVDPNGSPSSAPGVLCVDNIALVGLTSAVANPPKTANTVKDAVEDSNTPRNCGCGTGVGLALLPPLWFKTVAHRKRKKMTRPM